MGDRFSLCANIRRLNPYDLDIEQYQLDRLDAAQIIVAALVEHSSKRSGKS
jgi:hypothetical protein